MDSRGALQRVARRPGLQSGSSLGQVQAQVRQNLGEAGWGLALFGSEQVPSLPQDVPTRAQLLISPYCPPFSCPNMLREQSR